MPLERVLGDKRFKKFLENKYKYLFLSILLVFTLAPFARNIHLPVFSLLLLAVLLSVLSTLGLRRRRFVGLAVLSCAAAIGEFFLRAHAGRFDVSVYRSIAVAPLMGYTIVVAVAVYVLMHRIFAEKSVTGDTIQGGVSVYFLMGFLWAFLYQLVLLRYPHALSFNVGGKELEDVIYYSFVTLTTLGYGDITPATDFMKNLAVLEAALGQLFLTILVARLVTLHLRNK